MKLCSDCNKWARFHKNKSKADGLQAYCIECTKKRYGYATYAPTRKAKKTWYDDKHVSQSNRKKYVVVSDPLGIFNPGATFGKYDFEMTLKAECWPEGMLVLKEADGKQYWVEGSTLVLCTTELA